MYVLTDAGAPRGRLAVADPAIPALADWQDLIGEDTDAVLQDFAILDGEQAAPPLLLAVWARHGFSEITIHDLADGTRRGVITVPGPARHRCYRRRPPGRYQPDHRAAEGGHEAWFAYTDHSTPVTIYRYDARTGEVAPWARAPGSAWIPPVSARQVTYRSADGTEVRMVVISPPGIEPPGAGGQAAPRPTILTGYGGFSISLLTPCLLPAALAWVEAGGVYAIAGLRGGAEEGEAWHRAGMRQHKQRVFDDFHAAAAKLAGDGWTTPGQLAISGGSNGGLLVGAALTQWPASWAAVACSAPLLDMARYEMFGLGQLWNDEYGTAADPVELGWLLSYSPYHHVTDGVRYPPCCSPSSTATPGWTRCTPARCARRSSTPPRRGSPIARSCCAASHRSATGRAPSADPSGCPPIRWRSSPSIPGSRAEQCLAVLPDRTLLAVARRHRVGQQAGAAHHDLGAVPARHGEQGVQAQPQGLFRLVRLQPAPGQARG
jgi:prolyl oligopeptidase